MTDALTWQHITNRREARDLQGFACTSDLPRTPGGRKLPHERPWEWEAQAHLRELSNRLRSGGLVVVGRSESEILGCAHLQFGQDAEFLEVFHVAAGVSTKARGQGGEIADQLLLHAREVAMEHATGAGCTHVVLAGKIHVRNIASQRMVTRAGWEPQGVPTDYQLWATILIV
uniref:GNAT family N-acetyltransferase n=1 Tax=Gordonia sp. B7-2 TaxID=3420932 RepID=UPI003D8FB572